ncbi:MAG: UDP-N-acetylmuramate dehydrogenase [Bacteroidota bacterium]|nr:UDP-N-acetylmuramate dehydrogenase [Bacteroidota bacterium]
MLPFSLLNLNTFHIDAHCNKLIRIQSMDDLIRYPFKGHDAYYILGGGSNILILNNLQRDILKIDLKGIQIVRETDHDVELEVAAGENWHEFVMWTIQRAFYGIENLSLIPGTVGAAPVQNIGAYGVELKECLLSVQGIHIDSKKIQHFQKDACEFGYRDSVFKHELKGIFCITSIRIRLSKKKQLHLEYGAIKDELSKAGIHDPSIGDVSQAIIKIRKSKLPDPAKIGNAGSFFKNVVVTKREGTKLKQEFPEMPVFIQKDDQIKVPTAYLIEKAGWKGFRKGDAGCHADQALVLVNYGSASGQEVFEVAQQIMQDIHQKFGIFIQPEISIWS